MNSARMYAGPGTGSMLVAAAAWRGLAGELSAAASAYQQVVSGLTGQSWFGPASQSMAAAAAPYANWLATTAVSAEQAASALLQAVSDFEQAFAATVPPTAIAANRSLLAVLVASNAVGQNTASIAETEADYNQMWLQDAMAMYGYAARSAAATAVTPFTAPPTVVDPAAIPAQGVATGLASPGSTHAQLSELLGAIPHELQGLSAAGSAQAAPIDPVSQTASYIETLARSVLPANDTNISVLYGMGQYARNLNTDLDISQATGGRAGFGSGTTISTSIAGGAGPVVAASTGTAGAVGKLVAPSAWADSVPEVGSTATAAPATPPAASVAPAGPVAA
ncbi:MAG: PPE family protein, partial [Mycobacterium sp.]